MHRRHLLLGAAAPTLDRAQARNHVGLAVRRAALCAPAGRATPPENVFDSPAPAGPAGHWVARAAMPIPRNGMAWAAVARGRIHVVGGYGEGAVNLNDHHLHDPAADCWQDAAPLPRGANHGDVAADGARVYAFGGLVEQDWHADTLACADEVDRNRRPPIVPMPRPRHAVAAVAIGGCVHVAGGGAVPGGPVQSAVHEAFTLD